MSPFSSFKQAYGIDHDSPIFSAIDSVDRYFFRHHHLTNYFIPRFDLDEDAQFYYLSGEIPGAKVEDVTIEPGDNHTLVIRGTTHGQSIGSGGRNSNAEHFHENQAPAPTEGAIRVKDESDNVVHKPTTTSHLPKHHGHNADENIRESREHPGAKVLLSERLLGDFNRTFAFPAPIFEEGIRATMENGVLSLSIPKLAGRSMGEARKIPIMQGN